MAKETAYAFELPHVKGGVTVIGELWDCHKSTSVHHNLLNSEEIPRDCYKVIPLNKSDWNCTHIKSEKDELTSLSIDGTLKLDVLFGLVKLEGQGYYDKSDQSHTLEETFKCNYIDEQFKIYFPPPIKEELRSNDIYNKVCEGTIEATHVVGGMILGGEVIANLKVTDKSSEKNIKVNARGKSSIAHMKLDLNLSADGKYNNNEKYKDLDVQITVTARPAISKTPQHVDELMEAIDEFRRDIKKCEQYKDFGEDVRGIPIRFILYPLSHYVDTMDKIYRELTDSLQAEFISVLTTSMDFKRSGFIRRVILRRNHELQCLLVSKSAYLKEVVDLEENIKKIADDILNRSRRILDEYRRGKSDMNSIEAIVQEFYTIECSSFEKTANAMADEFTKELQRTCFDPTEEENTNIRRFTDRNELDIWFGKLKTRILLEIGPSCSREIVMRFLELAEPLAKLEVETAIAMPKISEKDGMIIKSGGRMDYFEVDKLTNALDVLDAILVTKTSTSHIFYKILGSILCIKVPIGQDETKDLDKIVRSLLTESLSQDCVLFSKSVSEVTMELNISRNRWLFCLPLGAPDTDLEVIKHFRYLSSKEKFKDVKWVFCKLDVSNNHEAPLLVAFFQMKTIAVCLDNLDILIMTEIWKSKGDADRPATFEILSPARLSGNSICKGRALYAIELLRLLNMENINCKIEEFSNEDSDGSLNDLMTVVRASLCNSTAEMASAVARIAIQNFSNFVNKLANLGWDQSSKTFDSARFEANVSEKKFKEIEYWKEKQMEKFNSDPPYPKRNTEIGIKHVETVENVFEKIIQQCSLDTIKQNLIDLYSGKSEIMLENTAVQREIGNYLKKHQLYHVLHTLLPFTYGQRSEFLIKAIRDLDRLDNSAVVADIVDRVLDNIQPSDIKALMRNEKWLYLIKCCLNGPKFKILSTRINENEKKIFFPEDILELTKTRLESETETSSSASSLRSDDAIGDSMFQRTITKHDDDRQHKDCGNTDKSNAAERQSTKETLPARSSIPRKSKGSLASKSQNLPTEAHVLNGEQLLHREKYDLIVKIKTFKLPGLNITNCIFAECLLEICYLLEGDITYDENELRGLLSDHLNFDPNSIKLSELNGQPTYKKTLGPGESLSSNDRTCTLGALVTVEGKGIHALMSSHGKQQEGMVYSSTGNPVGTTNVTMSGNGVQTGPDDNTWCLHCDVALARLENQSNYVTHVNMAGVNVGLEKDPIEDHDGMRVKRFTADGREGVTGTYVKLDPKTMVGSFLLDVTGNDGGPIHGEGESGTLIVKHDDPGDRAAAVGMLTEIAQLPTNPTRKRSLAVKLTTNFQALQKDPYCDGSQIQLTQP